MNRQFESRNLKEGYDQEKASLARSALEEQLRLKREQREKFDKRMKGDPDGKEE